MSSKQPRADLLSALQTLATSDLRSSATALLSARGYTNKKRDLERKYLQRLTYPVSGVSGTTRNGGFQWWMFAPS